MTKTRLGTRGKRGVRRGTTPNAICGGKSHRNRDEEEKKSRSGGVVRSQPCKNGQEKQRGGGEEVYLQKKEKG